MSKCLKTDQYLRMHIVSASDKYEINDCCAPPGKTGFLIKIGFLIIQDSLHYLAMQWTTATARLYRIDILLLILMASMHSRFSTMWKYAEPFCRHIMSSLFDNPLFGEFWTYIACICTGEKCNRSLLPLLSLLSSLHAVSYTSKMHLFFKRVHTWHVIADKIANVKVQYLAESDKIKGQFGCRLPIALRHCRV